MKDVMYIQLYMHFWTFATSDAQIPVLGIGTDTDIGIGYRYRYRYWVSVAIPGVSTLFILVKWVLRCTTLIQVAYDNFTKFVFLLVTVTHVLYKNMLRNVVRITEHLRGGKKNQKQFHNM